MINTRPLADVTPSQSSLITSVENLVNSIFGVHTSTPTTTTTPAQASISYDWVSWGVIGLAAVGIYYASKKKRK